MSVRHERELRQLWEHDHAHVHELEKEAVEKALESNNRRLDEMNELRLQITRERGEYVSRDTYDREHRALESSTDKRLKSLEQSKSYVIGWVAAIVLAINLVMYWLGKR
jgi:hypothetical protein